MRGTGRMMPRHAASVLFKILIVTWVLTPSVAAQEGSPCPPKEALQERGRKYLDDGLTVGRVRSLGIGGLCEVEVLIRGNRQILYTDPKGFVAILGPAVDLEAGRNLTRDALSELNRVSAEEMPALEKLVSFTLGSAERHVYVVADPTCPYCRKANSILKKMAEAGDLSSRYILFPLSDANKPKCVALVCDHKGLAEFEAGYTSDNQCEEGTRRIDEARTLLRRHGVASTPSYIFADGRTWSGVLTEQQLRAQLGLAPKASSEVPPAASPAPAPLSPAGSPTPNAAPTPVPK